MSNKNRTDIHNSDVPVVCQSCEARHGGICGVLKPEQLVVLNKHANRTAHDRDTELTRLNGDGKTYANILSGVVKLTKLMADGRQQIVGLQFAPDFLGRPASSQAGIAAEATTDVRLCTFPKHVLDQLVEESPEMKNVLHEQHMRELDEAREWMLTLGRKTALEKVASFLLMICLHIDPEREDSEKPMKVELPLKRVDIADFLGLTIETVSRQLTNLRKKGVINIDERRAVLIINFKHLEKLANEGSA